MALLHFNADDFNTHISKEGGAVIVDFFATWCGPCKILSPIIEELAAEFDGKITVGKLDIDENPELAVAYKVSAVPTVIYFKNGEAVQTLIGVQPKEVLKEAAKALI